MKRNRGIRRKSSFRIRKAGAADSPGILACLASAFAPYRDRYTPQAFADTVLTAESLPSRLGQMCLLVAVSNGEIVGTIGCTASGGEGHLRGMAVLPEWQGSGVASALLEAVESELRGCCTRITLDTTEPLQRAIRFYEKHGSSPSGRVSDFFGMDLYEYVKPL